MPRSKNVSRSRRAPANRAAVIRRSAHSGGDGRGRTDGVHLGTPAQGRELRARGRRTMRKLLDAGVEIFAQRGFHAARVDDIVKLAKTSHGTFYLYFSNKEELFRALAHEVAEEMISLADSLPPIDPGPEGRARLRAWLARFVEVYEHYGPVIRAWTEAEIGGSEFGRLGRCLLARRCPVRSAGGTTSLQAGRPAPPGIRRGGTPLSALEGSAQPLRREPRGSPHAWLADRTVFGD